MEVLSTNIVWFWFSLQKLFSSISSFSFQIYTSGKTKNMSLHLPTASIWHVVFGLTEGISRFAGPTKVAAIVGDTTTGEIQVFDDQQFLREHKAAIVDALKDWRSKPPTSVLDSLDVSIWVPDDHRKDNHLFQVWFAQSMQPRTVPIIAQWLGYGAARVYLSYRLQDEVIRDSFRRELFFFAPHVVADYLRIERHNILAGMERLDTNKIVKGLSKISQTLEEGSRPTGTIAFIETSNPTEIPDATELKSTKSTTTGIWDGPVYRLPKSIRLVDHKHVSKILRISPTKGCLLSDDGGIFGIAPDHIPSSAIVARFRSGSVTLEFQNKPVCRIINGEFVSPQTQGPFEILKLILSGKVSVPCLERLAKVALTAIRSHHGCSLTVVEDCLIPNLPGQKIDPKIAPNSFDELVAAMAHVDGALIFDKDGNLHAFGAILQGDPTDSEDGSRGSRYNSALRFSKANPSAIVLVVSEDGPMTVVQNNTILYRDPLNIPLLFELPEYLPIPILYEEWIKQGS